VTNGLFIAIEGGEGAGKSTHSKRLADYLESLGHEVVLTREPGGTPTAEKIRSILLDPSITDMPDYTEALLFAASRADHAANLIRPALARGATVICDRYIDSSVAYQGASRGLGVDKVRELSLWATENLIPDFTIYLDVPHEAGEQRMEGTDRMEIQSRDFHELVHQAFRDIAATSKHPNIVIDATAPKDDVAAQVRSAIDGVLASR
jgi:dTMP kinase